MKTYGKLLSSYFSQLNQVNQVLMEFIAILKRKDIGNVMNDYFCDGCPELASNIPNSFLKPDYTLKNCDCFHLNTATVSEFRDINGHLQK